MILSVTPSGSPGSVSIDGELKMHRRQPQPHPPRGDGGQDRNEANEQENLTLASQFADCIFHRRNSAAPPELMKSRAYRGPVVVTTGYLWDTTSVVRNKTTMHFFTASESFYQEHVCYRIFLLI